MKKLLPLIAIIIVLFVANGLKASFTQGTYFPYLVAEIDGSTKVTLLQFKLNNSTQCQRQISAVENAILQTCPNCKIVENSCLTDLSKTQQDWLTAPTLSMPTVRYPNGVALYDAAKPVDAMAACNFSEQLSTSNSTQFRVTCYPPNTNRQLGAEQPDRQKFLQEPLNVLMLCMGSIGLLMLILIVAARSHPQNHTNGRAFWANKVTLAGTDAIVLMASYAALDFSDLLDHTNLLFHFALTGIMLAWFWAGLEHYGRRRPFWDELREIYRTLAIFLLLAGATIFYTGLETGRSMTIWVWISLFVLLPLGRATAKNLLDLAGIWKLPVVILGAGENAKEAFLAINGERGMGYQIIGMVDIDNNHPIEASSLSIENQILRIYRGANIEPLLGELGNPKVIVALDSLATQESQLLIQQITTSQRNIHVIPSIRGLPLFGTELSHFFSHEVLFLTVRNNLARRSQKLTKRLFDLVTASLLLIMLAPVFITLTILIRKSGGAAFYGHPRIGRYGQSFKCLKFRSMRPDADKVLKELLANDPVARAEWEKDFKLKNDPRITPVGHFLRKTSLDELPQIINVIKGEMSLVGPRPVVKDELDRYGDAAGLYLEAKPGITGLWQVSGRNDTTYAERVSLDTWYVQNWSLWYDIAILFKTVDVVLLRKGAY